MSRIQDRQQSGIRKAAGGSGGSGQGKSEATVNPASDALTPVFFLGVASDSSVAPASSGNQRAGARAKRMDSFQCKRHTVFSDNK